MPWDGRFWLTLLSYTLLMSSVLIWNQIADLESDRINQKVFILPRGLVSIRVAWAQSLLLLVASGALGLFLGVRYMVLWGISALMGILYTTKPILLKGRPGAHILMNGLGYGMVAFLVGWNVAAELEPQALLRSIPYVLSVTGVTLSTTIPDIQGDRAAGEITLACLLGPKWAARLSGLIIFLALMAALLLRDPFVGLAGALSLPVFVWAGVKGDERAVKFSYRLGSDILVLLIGLRMLGLLALAILVYFGVKFYYSHRFGLTDYPSLRGR